MSTSHLVLMLSKTLGEEMAAELVANAVLERGFTPGQLSAEQESLVLDDLAKRPGIVGLAALLGKSRLHFERGASALAE